MCVQSVTSLPATLDALALVYLHLERWSDACRLLGAADRGRSDLGIVRDPFEAREVEGLEAALAGHLGDAAGTAHAEGMSLSLFDACVWARGSRGRRSRPADGWDSLTPTEARVVALVTEGLSNPQIAERLSISSGTVRVQFSHIFQKLDVHSRTELAVMVSRRSA